MGEFNTRDFLGILLNKSRNTVLYTITGLNYEVHATKSWLIFSKSKDSFMKGASIPGPLHAESF
jgi:hypothetical protein